MARVPTLSKGERELLVIVANSTPTSARLKKAYSAKFISTIQEKGLIEKVGRAWRLTATGAEALKRPAESAGKRKPKPAKSATPTGPAPIAAAVPAVHVLTTLERHEQERAGADRGRRAPVQLALPLEVES